MKRKVVSKLMVLSLVASLLVTPEKGIIEAATTYPSNPYRTAAGVATWDTIYFGNYYQNDTNKDGKANTSDAKQPIRWRVLSVNGSDAFIMAENVLDVRHHYHENDKKTEYYDTKGVLWKDSGTRKWLNSEFLHTAFTAKEQKAIKTTSVKNSKNPIWNIGGTASTNDKIYLLSIDEACNKSYGFYGFFALKSETRVAKNTTFAKDQEASSWLLRSAGCEDSYFTFVSVNGLGYYDYTDARVIMHGIRPVLHINLATSVWTNGSKISAKGADPGTGPTIPAKNALITNGSVQYKVTKSAAKNGTVMVNMLKNKKMKKVTIPATVKINGYTFNVNGIAAKAFANCKALKKIIIKSTSIKSIGSKAINKANKKLIIQVPKKKYKAYKKLFTKKTGMKSTMKIIKK